MLVGNIGYDLFLFPEKPPDEMERLYNHLKAAHLSVIGQSTRRDLRASFVRRCQDTKLDEKLQLLRILSSTLKVTQKMNDISMPKISFESFYRAMCSVTDRNKTDCKQIKSVFVSEL